MSNHSDPIVSHVLYVADQRHPWKLGALLRWPVRYHTPTTVRVWTGKEEQTRAQHQVYCLPDDASWARAEACRAQHQAAVDALAEGLRALGSYPTKLAAAGGIKTAPNPLSPTVISASDPDDTSTGYAFDNPVPRVARLPITEHTPKMLRGPSSYGPYETTFSQRDHFVCPDDAAWERIQQLRQACQVAADDWKRLLSELGSYDTALADGRYARTETPIAAIAATQQLAVVDAAIAVPMMDVAEAKETIAAMRGDLDQVDQSLGSFRQRALDFADREGWRALGYAGALEAINGELGTHYSKSYLSRLLGAARIEKLLELPMGNSEATPERVLREFARLDDPAERRQAWQAAQASAGGATPTVSQARQAVEQIKPPAKPVEPESGLSAAIAGDVQHIEAARRLLAEAEGAGERTGTRLYQEAYSHARQIRNLASYQAMMAAIDRAVEATAAPAAAGAAVASRRLTCPTCGETILNGVWGELKECGICYRARAQADAEAAVAAERARIDTIVTLAAPPAQPASPTPRDDWHNLPPLLAGWKWQTNTATKEVCLVAPDGSWSTKDYTHSGKRSHSRAWSPATIWRTWRPSWTTPSTRRWPGSSGPRKARWPMLRIRSGVCHVCGCTDAWGCAAGCFWVDPTHTLCSVCLQNISVFVCALARAGRLADLVATDPGARVAPLGEPAAATWPESEGL